MKNRNGRAESKLAAFVFLTLTVVILQGCQKPTTIPAIAIEGTYSVDSVYFADQSDSCTHVYDVYDSAAVSMSWRILYTQDNLVNVIISARSTGPTIGIDTICQLGHQYSFPDTLHGVVGSTNLVVERQYTYQDSTTGPVKIAFYQLGNFLVSNKTLTGSLVNLECDSLHCLGYRTRTFTLVKD